MKGFVISAIVGSVFIVSVFLLKNSMVQHSIDSVYDIAIKNEVETIRLLISNDLRYIGYGSASEIEELSDSHLRYTALVDGNVIEISWELLDDVPIDASNPNLRMLVRNGPMFDGTNDIHESTFIVRRFDVVAFADVLATSQTMDANSIRSLMVEVEVETKEAIGEDHTGAPRFPGASWSRVFRPENLRL